MVRKPRGQGGGRRRRKEEERKKIVKFVMKIVG
jgi:hypothetical protein